MAENGQDKVDQNSGRDEAGLTPAQRTWLKHIQQCEEEGLTYKAYCQREGLRVGSLYSARQTLRSAALSASTSPPRFAAVRLAHPQSVGTVELALSNGTQLRVALNSVDDVLRLIQALDALRT